MTEFRRASAAVDAIIKLVECLGSADVLSDETRSNFLKAKQQLDELAPTAEKMSRKCQARAELEALKAQLREQFPSTTEDPLKVAQEALDSGAADTDSLRAVVNKAAELDGLATYGVKMVEKVEELLRRLGVAQQRFNSEIAPRFGSEVASAEAEDAKRREAAEREAAAVAEAEMEKATAEARQPLAGLLSENEQKLQQLQQEREEAERERVAKEEMQRRIAAELEAENHVSLAAEEAGERCLAERGADAACGEALVSMLAAPVGKYREVLEALSAMICGIAAEPADGRRRLIRVANEGFQSSLGSHPGVWLFLRAAGFESCTRETLPAGLSPALGIGPGPAAERFLWCQEPDMFNSYEKWLAWHERLRLIGDFLQELERLAFRRIAHLGQHGLDIAAHTVIKAAEVMQAWNDRCQNS